MDSVVFFPNSEVEVDGETAWTTEAAQKFVAGIGVNRMVILAAASAPRVPGSRHNSVLQGASGIQFFSLGYACRRPTPFWKAMGYIAAFLRMLLRLPKKPLWYVFLPGHMGTLACLVCCLLGKQYGAYVRGEWPKSGIAGVLYRWYFKRASFIFATGAAFTDTLRQFNNQVEEVAPMMRFSLKDFLEKPSYEIDGRARILLVGAIEPTKGAFEIVKAMPYVAKQCDVELKVIGSGSPEITKDLLEEIQTSGCADRIELVGHIGDKQQLATWFASADIFAFPTYYKEGFPRVVYEAMGFGLPVICTDIEGGKLFLRDRENCRIVAKKDVADLANALIELLSDRQLRAALGKRAFLDAQSLCTRYEGVSHGSQVAKALAMHHRND
jgi:glycosyltransferase involved in cell wall biosynthesis